jgi:hypothetical protein
MGKISIDQSHALIQVLATNIDWSAVDSNQVQKIITNPKSAGLEFQNFLNSFEDSKNTSTEYLRKLVGNLILNESDGQNTIADSKNVFYSIDSDFKNYGANEKGVATPKTRVEVHELIKNGTFRQIFGSLNSDLDKLCFTQDQILNFIKNHKSWLRTDGYGTFFLFKSNGKFFVAYVFVHSDGLVFHVHHFDDVNVWNAVFRYRFVFPQLEKLES